jgi:hypothetical protein
MKWTDDKSFTVGEHMFFSCLDISDFFREIPDEGFFICKSRSMLETLYNRLAYLRGGNIVELGVFRGGSTVWLSEMLKPKKLVAFEYGQQPVAVLERYIEQSQNGSVVRPYYGVNQKYARVIHNTLKKEFGNEQLDIVVDDASHFLEETRISFNALFPRLRPGGIFVLEDWGWSHTLSDVADDLIPPHLAGKSPLTTLVMETIICCARQYDVVDNVYIDGYTAFIQRGNAELDWETFDISSFVSVGNGYRFVTGFEHADSKVTASR